MKTARILRGLAIFMLLACFSCDMDSLLGYTKNTQLTEAEVIAGLKNALSVGIDTASVQLHAAGGYLLNTAIKILLPEDVATALDYVESLSSKISPLTSALAIAGVASFDFSVFNGMRDSMITSMNRAAEKAAPLSVSIFKNAITGMTIQDGFNVLRGDSTAATVFLKTETFDPLTGVFEPFVDSTLKLVGAQVYWQNISTNYNLVATFYNSIPSLLRSSLPSLPFNSLNTNLSLFTTQKALDGLFYTVGQQETLIRSDPLARVTEILRKVFGSVGVSE